MITRATSTSTMVYPRPAARACGGAFTENRFKNHLTFPAISNIGM